MVPPAVLGKIQDCRPQLLRNARGGNGQLPPGVACNGYQWDVIYDNGDIYKGGWAGQGLLINPGKDLVAVWTGYIKDDAGSELPLQPRLRQVLNAVYPDTLDKNP